jgi:hypothetical protein
MENKYTKENNQSRKRLQKLVNVITDEELNMVIYEEGWTIAAALGHLAFWDERRAAVVRYWKQRGVQASGIAGTDTHVLNDALVPFFLAIPVRKLAKLAVQAAEKADKALEELPVEMLPSIEALGDIHALNRSIHRKIHLDEIDTLLKVKRGR